MAKLGNAVSRKPSTEADDDSEFAAFGGNTRPADAAMPSGVPNPDSAFMPRLSDYARPPFPPGFDATYSGPMGPPSRSPLMPPPIYPAPPPYPPAQQAGYPQMQPWQPQPPAGSPYAQAPYAGHVPYPPQAVAPQPPAYAAPPSPEPDHQAEESAEQAPIEEIRASLREFREAVRELTESRTRRRYF